MLLDETIAIRTPSGQLIALIEAGADLPRTTRETLSTSSDGQDAIRCTLVTQGRHARDVAYLEVAVRAAPRGIALVTLVVHVDGDGSARAEITADHGSANASFSVATKR